MIKLMYVDITYVRDKQLIESSVVYYKETEKEINLALAKKVILDFIRQHGYYYVKSTVVESKNKKNRHKILVDNCFPVKIKKICIYNTNIDSNIDLSDIERDINYLFSSKIADAKNIRSIANNIYEVMRNRFFIVKDLKIMLELNDANNHECNVICTIYVGNIDMSCILTVNINSQLYSGTVAPDIEGIYSNFFNSGLLSYQALKNNLLKYINHHTYVKKINIFFSVNDAGQQILDNRINLNIMAYLAIHNKLFMTRSAKDLSLYHAGVLDGNILNILYFRIVQTYPMALTGINLRYKIDVGYKRTIYVGVNYYLEPFRFLSDVNIITKFKYFFNPKVVAVGRLNFRYYFVRHSIHFSGIAGMWLGVFKLNLYAWEVENFCDYKVGISTAVKLNSKLSKANLFIGFIGFNEYGIQDKFQYIYLPLLQLYMLIYDISLVLRVLVDHETNFKQGRDMRKYLVAECSISKKVYKALRLGVRLSYDYRHNGLGLCLLLTLRFT